MTFSSALMGGATGYGIMILTNYIRKYPLLRQPWFHVSYAMFGAYIGQKIPQWEKSLVEDINKLRKIQGMPPLMGTPNAWVRYAKPEGELEELKRRS